MGTPCYGCASMNTPAENKLDEAVSRENGLDLGHKTFIRKTYWFFMLLMVLFCSKGINAQCKAGNISCCSNFPPLVCFL